jgi:hypothetical protein
MPAPPNPLLESEFLVSTGPGDKKSVYLTCRNCTDFSQAKNNSRALDHLRICAGYLAKQAARISTDDSTSRKRQRTLTVSTMPVTRKRKLDSMAAMAVYMGARPFQLWEDPYMRDFIIAATDNLYRPPNRILVGGDLLDQQYAEVQSKVNALIRSQESLNFVLDESSNIRSQRIVNLSVVIPQYGSIYLANENIGRQDLTASFFTDWFTKRASQYDLTRVSSLTTDTCATMRNTWTGLEHLDLLSHALFIPCDSHGLQLLIKDLLDQPQIAAVMSKAHAIVTGFHQAKKQYAILQSKQEQAHALLLSVLTRWGTQLTMVKSLLKNKSALYLWVADPKAQMGKKGENTIALYITDSGFWTALTSIEQIIQPIHEAQKMSESNGSTLAKVVPRWQKLEQDLRTLSTVHKELMGNFMDIRGPFQLRAQKQTGDLHFAAMLLDPISLLKRPGQEQIDRASQYLFARVQEKEKREVHASFLEFRTRSSVFGSTHPSALHYDSPVTFWKSYLHDETHCVLAQLAVRIFEAIANSVASERAFSAMNLIHTKLRNRLGAEKANKLVYIYMNQRILDRNSDIFVGDPVEKTPEEQVLLEEAILELVGSDDVDFDDN